VACLFNLQHHLLDVTAKICGGKSAISFASNILRDERILHRPVPMDLSYADQTE
jgi:hypothetical protein